MKAPKQHWLIKSEPTSYGIDHLEKDGTTAWTGVRNYQARNFMRSMNPGDAVLFYHSSCPNPGVYGIANISVAAYSDETQFDAKSPYYEPRATADKPLWDAVSVTFVKRLKTPVLLTDIRADKSLSSMMLLHPGSRLSITPVTKAEFDKVKSMT